MDMGMNMETFLTAVIIGLGVALGWAAMMGIISLLKRN